MHEGSTYSPGESSQDHDRETGATPGRVDGRELGSSSTTAPLVALDGATFVPRGEVKSRLPGDRTIVIRAINSGDMYHVRAAFVLGRRDPKGFPGGPRLLIWGVSPTSRRQAHEMVTLFASPDDVFYTDDPSLDGYTRTETWCTAYIERRMTGGLDRFTEEERAEQRKAERAKKSTPLDDSVGGLFDEEDDEDRERGPRRDLTPEMLLESSAPMRAPEPRRDEPPTAPIGESARDREIQSRRRELTNDFAPYTELDGQQFAADLAERGQIQPGTGPYVVVNFRATGHSDRPGANAPALDTGVAGMKQLIVAIYEKIPGAIVVPMGDNDGGLRGPNLLNYWMWPSVQGSRLRQASLMRYFNETCNVVGVVGMRSGVIDQLVFAGMRVLSIDITPHKGLSDLQQPSMSTPKGWDRGAKLEEAFGSDYGHVFIEHAREGETERNVEGWEGRFDDRDIATIKRGVGGFFGEEPQYKRESQPLLPENLDNAFSSITTQLGWPQSAYDLFHNFVPYLNHISDKRSQDTRWTELCGRVRTAMTAAEQSQPVTIEWMANHQCNTEPGAVHTKRYGEIQSHPALRALGDPIEVYRRVDREYTEKTIKVL